MNRVALMMSLALLTSVACGQRDPASTTSAVAPAGAPASDPETVKKAGELLEAVAKTYREAPAFTDTINLQIEGPGFNQKQDVTLEAGTGRDLRMVLNDFEFTVVGDQLYVTHKDASEKYFVTKVDATLDQTLTRVFGANSGVPMPLALRLSKPGDKILDHFVMNMLPGSEIVGMGSAKGADGGTVSEVYVGSQEGTGVVSIDSEQKLVKAVSLQRKPANAPGGFEIKGTFTLSPKIVTAALTTMVFDPGQRSAVDNVSRLIQVSPGDMSPDFTLTDAAGKPMKLSELRGSAVVLDFWATWCGPCRRALPMLEQFHKYTQESGQPVKVFAVDVWEKQQTNDEKKATATKFWTAQKYTTPLVFDFEGTVARTFGIQAIPTTVVIGPDGRVAQIHRGASDNMVELLKKETSELINQKPKTAG